MLTWLTDDTWELRFRPARRPGPLHVAQGYLLDLIPEGAPVALFSGGLDSTAGLAAELAADPGRDVIAVRVVSNGRMQGRQREVLERLGGRVHDCAFRCHLRRNTPARERTQRTRGFLFLSAGIATAWAAGRQALRVYENGVGAINLPMLESQWGSQSPHAVHPLTIQKMERLAASLSGEPFRIELPYLWSTKADLLRQAPPLMAAAYGLSYSCDTAFSTHTEGGRPCGKCTSCILRTQSVIASGLRHIDAGQRCRADRAEVIESWEMRAMLCQVNRLGRALRSADPWRRLLEEFPQIRDVPDAESERGRRGLLGLYGRYCAEWRDTARELGISLRDWGLEGAAAA